MKEVAVRKYGGKVNAGETGRVNDVNFEDPGIQARRNIHTYSPYRPRAGFRVNNKTHEPSAEDLFICNSPDVGYRKRLKQHHTAWVHRKFRKTCVLKLIPFCTNVYFMISNDTRIFIVYKIYLCI